MTTKGIHLALLLFAMVTTVWAQESVTSHPDRLRQQTEALQHAMDYNNPATWDSSQLSMEVDYVEHLLAVDLPFSLTPFPTPHYESPGNGNKSISTTAAGRSIIGEHIMFAPGEHTTHLGVTHSSEQIVYFTILTLADGTEADSPTLVSSRNHPNYLGQGSFNPTTTARVDWAVVQMANGSALAVVNGRVFDLNAGRMVLVVPKQDGSVRFYQFMAPAMSESEASQYVKTIMNDQRAIDLISAPGNI